MKGSSNKSLGRSAEDYLEAIYILHNKNKRVRITDIANFLDVKKSSTVNAVKKLENLGLVKHERYADVILTKQGKEIASKIYERHKIIVDFFIKVLGIEEKDAEKDACKIEHYLSEKTLKKLMNFVNFFESIKNLPEVERWLQERS